MPERRGHGDNAEDPYTRGRAILTNAMIDRTGNPHRLIDGDCLIPASRGSGDPAIVFLDHRWFLDER